MHLILLAEICRAAIHCNADLHKRWLCRWQLLDVAAGRVKSKPVQTGKGGVSDVIQWTMATAKANHLTVLRSFGHGTDAGFPLQTKPGTYNSEHTKQFMITSASLIFELSDSIPDLWAQWHITCCWWKACKPFTAASILYLEHRPNCWRFDVHASDFSCNCLSPC